MNNHYTKLKEQVSQLNDSLLLGLFPLQPQASWLHVRQIKIFCLQMVRLFFLGTQSMPLTRWSRLEMSKIVLKGCKSPAKKYINNSNNVRKKQNVSAERIVVHFRSTRVKQYALGPWHENLYPGYVCQVKSWINFHISFVYRETFLFVYPLVCLWWPFDA